jgi:hypothetical protein
MPPLIKAFPYITAHYRIDSHTISAVWTTLTYATQWRFHKFLTPNIVDRGRYIDSSSSRPLLERSVRFASPMGRSDSLSWLSTIYFQYSQLIVGILGAPQVSHCLRAAFGLHHRREGQTPSADWGSLPSYLNVGASLQKLRVACEYGLTKM